MEEVDRLVCLFTENKDVPTMHPIIKRAVCSAVFTYMVTPNESLTSDDMERVRGMDIDIFERIQTREQLADVAKNIISSFLI